MIAENRRGADGNEPVSAGGSRGGSDSWLTWAARLGYGACGVVYIVIGVMAAAVAGGFIERPGGTRRAMLVLARQPFGEILLVALGVGFLGYAVLNVSGALRDPEGRGRSLAGILIRGADALTGALYVTLAVAAISIAAAPAREGGRMIEIWATGILTLPGGALLLGGIGLGLIGAAGFTVHRARAERFEDVLDRRALSSRIAGFIAVAARLGTFVRGVVLGISGLLVVIASVTRRPDRVGGIGDSLSAIDATPAGAFLLGIAALGFVAYGLYQLAKVRYRRVQVR